MKGVVFLGDELSATGFRLTGIETATPQADEAEAAFDAACARAALVVLTAGMAGQLGERLANRGDDGPVIAIVPDVLGRTAPPDLAGRLRRTLGIET